MITESSVVNVTSSFNDEVTKEIFGFTALPKGWNYGRGGPIRSDTAMSAAAILSVIRDLNFDKVESFPEINGSVMLSAHSGSEFVEVTCRPDKLYAFEIIDSESDDDSQESITFGEAIGCLRSVARQSTSYIFGSSTQETIVSTRSDTQVTPLKTMTTAYRFFNWNVPPQLATQYVSIVGNFTQKSGATHQYSGVSVVTNFQATPA